MSTSLEDLESGSSQFAQSAQSAPGPRLQGDERRVNSILSEMSAAATVQPQPQYSQQSTTYSPQVITVPPISTSIGSMRMDPDTARAHVIGSSSPSAADFQTMFQQRQANVPAPNYASQVAWTQSASVPESKPWKEMFLQFLRGPIAVAVIVFLLNMPIVTTLFSRYAQWMYLISGEVSVSGLLVKSLLAALLFASYQGVSSALA